MLRSDKLLITIICSLVCSCLFTLGFINIAYCEDNVYHSSFQFEYNDNITSCDFNVNSSTDDFLICINSGNYYPVNNFGWGAVIVSESSFSGDVSIPYISSSSFASEHHFFTWHGLTYDYDAVIIGNLLPSVNNLHVGSYGAITDFNAFNLSDDITFYDYIYLVYKGVINDDNFNYPEGYYIPDNVQIVESNDTMSSAYDSNKAITCKIAIPNTTHASYLNVKDVKVNYDNVLAYLTYNFSFSSIFAKKFQFYDVEINPTILQNTNIPLLSENVKYEKYFCNLPYFDITRLRLPLQSAVANYNINLPDNVDSVSMPYDNQGDKNMAFSQYKRNNENLNDYIYPNLPTSKSITYSCTLSDANYKKESAIFEITAMFNDDGSLSSVYYSGGTQPNGTEVKPQAYSDSQNYNNLISKNDSEQGNQNDEDLTDDAEEEGKTLVTNTNDWNDINIDNVGFKGTLTSLFDMLSSSLPFLHNIMFFVPSWVFALMGVVLATIVIMRILGR